ncbi:nitroreductase family protein [Planomonospora venezuelensis]|uniref:Nitroreductase n=1 Tax=Planomonospora venezuelensis TaxID=1999 RepID=A0A841DGF7_PLAVE|nr:nitroreductase family protein [Planomonospora venezuelensis]MBB5968107.1 nitroreductase [Planomonospora venezuelensis]GIN05548.1 oxidoreductase [Planomonospora venezuelensis]
MARPHSHPFVPYRPARHPEPEMIARGREFYAHMDARRSVRFFSDEPVPRECVELAVRTANTAPSGAHQQPWKFVIIGDPGTKRRIREAAEAEERRNYEGGRLTPEWREALAPLETDSDKGYLETVPWLVVCFAEKYGLRPEGARVKHYYVNESVGIACGLLIAALHTMGLSTLTHTPNPMAFLSEICGRPGNERPYILFPIGYAAPDAEVPDLVRKPFSQVVA